MHGYTASPLRLYVIFGMGPNEQKKIPCPFLYFFLYCLFKFWEMQMFAISGTSWGRRATAAATSSLFDSRIHTGVTSGSVRCPGQQQRTRRRGGARGGDGRSSGHRHR